MTVRTWGVAFLLTLTLSAVARSQTGNSADATGVPSSVDASTFAGALAQTANLPLDLKEQVRTGFVQLITGMIHELFLDLRVSFGLPAIPVDPVNDPLAILESVITTGVSSRLKP